MTEAGFSGQWFCKWHVFLALQVLCDKKLPFWTKVGKSKPNKVFPGSAQSLSCSHLLIQGHKGTYTGFFQCLRGEIYVFLLFTY